MAEIKGIIFDLGSVLAPHGTLIQEAGFISEKLGVSEYEAISAVEHSNYSPAEVGQEMSIDFWRRIFNELNVPRSDNVILELMHSWVNQVSIISQPMLDLVGQLRTEYKVGLLSNTSAEYIPVLRDKNFFEHFDNVVLSYEVGLRKPDPAIYELAAEHLNIPPQQLVFVDDMAVNVEAANKFGMRGIIFQDIDQLKRDLAVLGVLK
jgi:epoxide hydrolase-like predicted phosphatase